MLITSKIIYLLSNRNLFFKLIQLINIKIIYTSPKINNYIKISFNIKLNIFNKKYNLIEIPDGEEIVANSLRINDNLLIPKGFKKTQELLSKNYNLKLLDVGEISKVDAGLSCMSLRW